MIAGVFYLIFNQFECEWLTLNAAITESPPSFEIIYVFDWIVYHQYCLSEVVSSYCSIKSICEQKRGKISLY